MRIKITSDSTCDLSKRQLERYNITMVPLYVVKDNQTLKDREEITPSEIFRHVDNGGALCTTAAVNIEDYTQIFSEFSKEFDAVIHINIGADFSCSHQNALIAAQEFDNVYIVDSKNLCGGQGCLVLRAAQMAEDGMDPQEICGNIEKLREKVEASFIIDRLDYMRKGGRCSLIAEFGANIMRLKICIEVKDGKLQVAKKYSGSFEHCIDSYSKERLIGRDDIDTQLLLFAQAEASPEAISAARKNIQEFGKFREIEEIEAGCTISCHCGPNTIGLFYMLK